MTADNILDLLSIRHSKDVFVPECKNGPTWGTQHRRLDAIAIHRSWTRPRIIGYEIKVSRSDYLSDKKWRSYLPVCNVFYFVTPWKLIEEREVPKEAGLIYASKNGNRLYTRRHPTYRQIESPADMLRYIVYSRAKIVRSNYAYYDDNSLEYWEARLAEKKRSLIIGTRVTKRIQTEFIELRKELWGMKHSQGEIL